MMKQNTGWLLSIISIVVIIIGVNFVPWIIISSNNDLHDNSQYLGVSCNNNTQICDAGRCVANNCICDRLYATLPSDVNLCEYKRKDQCIALILSATPITGIFGADLYYAGAYIGAVFKMILPMTMVLWMAYTYIFWVSGNHCRWFMFNIPLPMAILTWYIVDIVFFRLNKITDENDVPLAICTF